MELEGLKRCLQTLADEDIVVSDLTTDRHPQVKKFMRDKHPEVNHWFDVWHVSKCKILRTFVVLMVVIIKSI